MTAHSLRANSARTLTIGFFIMFILVPYRGLQELINSLEFTVLVCTSGCGKSTLLRTIAGLEDADLGDIAIGDQIVNGMRPRDRDVAMVFQDCALYPHMTRRS